VKFDRQMAVWSGLAGFGLLAVGAFMYWQDRKLKASTGMVAGMRNLGRVQRFARAPMIDSFNDGNMKTTLRESADMPIEERIAELQKLVHKSVQDPEMRKLALQITRNCPERDQMCEAEAVYQAIKSRVRYTGDIGPIMHPRGEVEGIDLYQSARRTWEFGGGDCDDNAVLGATLLALNGIESRFRVVRQKADPDWSHIYAFGVIGNSAVPIDTTLPGNQRFGQEGPYAKSRDFDVIDLPA
jgi:transglutaminase-like putative cysteine protease